MVLNIQEQTEHIQPEINISIKSVYMKQLYLKTESHILHGGPRFTSRPPRRPMPPPDAKNQHHRDPATEFKI